MIQNILLRLPLQPQEDAGLCSCECHVCQSHRDIGGTLGRQNDTICSCLRNWILSASIILVYCLIFYCLWKLTWVYMHSWKEVLSEILYSSSIPLMFLSKDAQVCMVAANNNPIWKLTISHCFLQKFLQFSEVSKQWRPITPFRCSVKS